MQENYNDFINKIRDKKIRICGQWETWYIVEKNNSFGYIPTKYFVI